MKIGAFYSHLNGWEYLQVHQKYLWDEIQEAIANVDAEQCRTKVSKEYRMQGELKYSPKDMNAALGNALELKGWKESKTNYYVTRDSNLIKKTLPLKPEEQKTLIEKQGEEAIFSYNQTDFVKDRVAVEVQFGKYAFVAFDLFVKHMAFFVGDVIDIGIEILPMKTLQSQMSSGPGYYERELYNLLRQGRGIPAVPLIIVGIEA